MFAEISSSKARVDHRNLHCNPFLSQLIGWSARGPFRPILLLTRALLSSLDLASCNANTMPHLAYSWGFDSDQIDRTKQTSSHQGSYLIYISTSFD